MMYPFMTLNDGTEIVHSETLPDGRVKVYIEKPDAKDCFHHVTCYLPDYSWEDQYGFTDEDWLVLGLLLDERKRPSRTCSRSRGGGVANGKRHKDLDYESGQGLPVQQQLKNRSEDLAQHHARHRGPQLGDR